MKKTIFLFCFCAVQLLQAQQTPLFSVYRDQWSILNPAAIAHDFDVDTWITEDPATGAPVITPRSRKF